MKLDAAQHDETYRQLAARLLDGLSPATPPLATIVVAQPGAGKSGYIARLALPNTLALNMDALRAFHPKFDEIRRDHGYDTSDATDHDARQWATRLMIDAAQRHLNVVVEATAQNPDNLLATIAGFRRDGYQVHLHALAVPAADSVLGIFQRYEADPTRWTGLDFHDRVYAVLPAHIDWIAQSGLLDRVLVMDREGTLLHEGGDTGIALAAARDAVPTDAQRQARLAGWEAVVAAIAQRPATPDWHRNEARRRLDELKTEL